jgi:hypothetical protein
MIENFLVFGLACGLGCGVLMDAWLLLLEGDDHAA